MLIKDELHKYVPPQWTILHPNLYGEALKCVSMAVAEVALIGENIYWRRLIDDPKFELGL